MFYAKNRYSVVAHIFTKDELATALGDDPLIPSEARTPEIIQELVVNTVRNLKSAANKTVPTKDFKPMRKHYWSPTLTSALNRKVKLCWRKWSHEGKPRDNRKQSFIDYKRAKRDFRKAQRQAIHENEIASFEQLERQHDIDRSKFYNKISKLKKRKGNEGDAWTLMANALTMILNYLMYGNTAAL